jgi:hypothetical protein
MGSQQMLVGDRERDRVLEKLKQAYVEGRLTLDELRERTTTALSARTEDDLRPALAGLPGPSPLPATVTSSRPGAVVEWHRPWIPIWPLAIAALILLPLISAGAAGEWHRFPPFFAIFFFAWWFLRPWRRGRRRPVRPSRYY